MSPAPNSMAWSSAFWPRFLALACPQHFAQEVLGHNSKAVHHAYSKHDEVTVPSLDDWEMKWKKAPQAAAKPKMPKMVAVKTAR